VKIIILIHDKNKIVKKLSVKKYAVCEKILSRDNKELINKTNKKDDLKSLNNKILNSFLIVFNYC
jgi:hypothetical protein